MAGWQQVWPLSPACDPAHLSRELPSCSRMATSPQLSLPLSWWVAARPNKQPDSKEGAAVSPECCRESQHVKSDDSRFGFPVWKQFLFSLLRAVISPWQLFILVYKEERTNLKGDDELLYFLKILKLIKTHLQGKLIFFLRFSQMKSAVHPQPFVHVKLHLRAKKLQSSHHWTPQTSCFCGLSGFLKARFS